MKAFCLILISFLSNLDVYTSTPINDDDQACMALAKAFPQLESTDGVYLLKESHRYTYLTNIIDYFH
jgi:hypothetical protein